MSSADSYPRFARIAKWPALVASVLIQFLAFAANAASQGTAFMVGPRHAVTAFHVVEEATEIQVRTISGVMRGAAVVAMDVENDLAVIRLEGESLSAPQLLISGGSALRKGQSVLALGFPLSSMQGSELKVTDGIVSSTSGPEGLQSVFQVSTPIQPGNSGGPLVNRTGEVVGVVVSTLNPIRALKSTGALPQNVNFAVKSEYVIRMLQDNQITIPKRAKATFSRTEDMIAAVEPGVLQVFARNPEKERIEAQKTRDAEYQRIREEAERSARARIESERQLEQQRALANRRELEGQLAQIAQLDSMLASQEQSLLAVISQARAMQNPLRNNSGIADISGYMTYQNVQNQAVEAQRQLSNISSQRAELRRRHQEISRKLQ